MVLTKLGALLKIKKITPEELAARSKGEFSNMTVRRAIKGSGIDRLKALAIAKRLKVNVKEIE